MSVDVLCLCTGNATRSVLAEALLAAQLPHVRVASAGTLVVEGQPMSWRTRAAFEAIDVPVPTHRSKQVDLATLGSARLVLAAAPEHVAWIRRQQPELAHRTLTMKRLARLLATTRAESLDDLLRVAGPAQVVIEEWEEILDPGGLEVDAYVACGREIAELVEAMVDHLAALFPPPPQ